MVLRGLQLLRSAVLRSAAGIQSRGVITRGIRELVSRDWSAVRENKDAYWAERIARLGPGEAFRVAEELRRQMILRDPDWPDAALREADLLSHARLAEILRRAGPARRR
jgi:hypothetical protein